MTVTLKKEIAKKEISLSQAKEKEFFHNKNITLIQGDEEKILEGLDCLKKLKEKGLIRIYGMSSKTLKGGLAALKKSDLAMIHYNQEYCKEEEIIQLAQKEKKGILIKKAFQSGYLAAVKDEAEKKRNFKKQY